MVNDIWTATGGKEEEEEDKGGLHHLLLRIVVFSFRTCRQAYEITVDSGCILIRFEQP